MKISVFGLGYVGCVSDACFAELGHQVTGVDINESKTEAIKAGRPTVAEPGLASLTERVVDSGRLQATSDPTAAVHRTDLSLICVGTPSLSNSSLDLSAVETVVRQIGAALSSKDGYHTIVMRSTVLPGTLRRVVVPLIERQSGRRPGSGFGVAMNPEFLREANAVADFYDPSLTLIGALDEKSGLAAGSMYEGHKAPLLTTTIEVAEMAKYANNAFHALKVAFANEIGKLSRAHGIDGREVMSILCRDSRLNISPAYLRPGAAYGGSCLPKDTDALVYRAKEADIDTPLLNAIPVSNDRHIRHGIAMIEGLGRKKIAVLGLSFKSGTDDVRQSQVVPLVETLTGRGYEVSVYDEHVRVNALIGANKAFLEEKIPHIASLLQSDLDRIVAESEVIVVAKGGPEFARVPGLIRSDQVLVDFVGITDGQDVLGDYEGVCW
jgi:GDP-mannose 6-dehydrogenase